MPAPAPRLTSAVTEHNKQAAMQRAREYATGVGRGFNLGMWLTGPVAINPFLRGIAGLDADLATLKARAATAGVRIPGHIPANAGTDDIVSGNAGELIRGWAYAYAPDLISSTVEQHGEALANWKWW